MWGKEAVIWIAVIYGIIGTVSGQFPDLDLPLPLNLHLERNWQVSPTAPVGTVVARVFQELDNEKQVTFSLQGPGKSIPFTIDNATGVVTVNDTLKDKENQTYSLWVIANDGSLQQSTEVFAIITDRPGYKHIRHPFRPPPFSQFPLRPPSIPKLPPQIPMTPHINNLIPKQANEETTTKPIVTTKPATTATYPSKNIEENVENTISETPKTEDFRSGTNDTEEVKAEESDISLTIIPIAAISGLVAVTAVVIAVLWKRNILYKCSVEDSKKDVKAKDSNGIVLQDSINIWNGPRAYSNRYEPWDNNHLQVTEETSTTTVKEDEVDEWEFPRHRLRIYNIVGEGAFGQVWRAQATDIDGKKGEVTVAVKTLKENATMKEKSDLLQELDVMKNLGTHPNVVRLVGCCTEKEPSFVIMEFVSLGKLQSFLRDSRASRHYGNTHGGSRSLTSRDLTHFAYQVARGMDFLTSKGIIHRDLAARNVLINEERTCKVADFGFARDVGGAHVYERKSDGRLPIRWMAPESLYDDIFSVKSDIWSFGVLIWEIVTLGSTPYPGLSAGDVMTKVREGHRLEKPEHCKRELYNIMFYCWEADPDYRPDFAECVSLLEKLLCTETDYIELERFPDHSYYNVQNLEGEKV